MGAMNTRRLGDSGIDVSAIALGSWLTYSGGIGREQTEACTRAAFDAGITFFDTANVYGRGAAESAWGEILTGYAGDSYTLATKVYFPVGGHDRGLSRAQILKQIDGSLARLQTDYVDLYQCHRYDDDVPLEETMGALTEVVEAGKARWIGFSEWPPDRIQAALDMPGVAKFVSSQPQYSLLWRGPKAEVIPLCASNGISQVVRSPLAQGVLTGKYRPGEAPPADSRATSSSMNRFIKQWLNDEMLAAVQALRPIADAAGLSMSQLALAWILRQDNVASAIIGATRPEQVHENAAAAGVELADDVLHAVDDALDGVDVGGGGGERATARARTAVPYAQISVHVEPSSDVSKRKATIAVAPLACASSTRRWVACSRPSASIFVMPLSSPPTSDLKEAPICEPTLRERTVSPKTSPSTSSISYPGSSFIVEMSMGAPYGARTSRSRSIARWLTRRSQARTSGAARRSRRGTRSKASSKRTPVRAGPSAVRGYVPRVTRRPPAPTVRSTVPSGGVRPTTSSSSTSRCARKRARSAPRIVQSLRKWSVKASWLARSSR